MGARVTSREKGMREWPDSPKDQRSKATGRSGEITQSQTNSVLFRYTLDYQSDMIQLITRSDEAIRSLHDCIWDVVRRVMESAGKSAANRLDIALCLVNMLPSIPLHLTFNTAIADLPGFMPEALSYASQPITTQGVMTMCEEETLTSTPGTVDQAMQVTWCRTETDTDPVKPMASRSEGHNDPNIPEHPFLWPRVPLHSLGAHLDIKCYVAHCTLLADPHLKTVFNDQCLTVPTPVHRLLATRAQLSQSLIANLQGVIPTVRSDHAPTPQASSS